MAVSVTIEASVAIYPNSRPGPLGEIGIWAGQATLVGDVSGGGATHVITLPNFNNKLAFTVDHMSFNTSDANTALGNWTVSPRFKDNEGFVGAMQAQAGAGVAASSFQEDARSSPMVFSPIGRNGDPNLIMITPNVNAITTVARAHGRIYPHQVIQRQSQVLGVPVGPGI